MCITKKQWLLNLKVDPIEIFAQEALEYIIFGINNSILSFFYATFACLMTTLRSVNWILLVDYLFAIGIAAFLFFNLLHFIHINNC